MKSEVIVELDKDSVPRKVEYGPADNRRSFFVVPGWLHLGAKYPQAFDLIYDNAADAPGAGVYSCPLTIMDRQGRKSLSLDTSRMQAVK